MAEALKDQYTLEYPQKIASQIVEVYPKFQHDLFLERVAIDYDTYELLPRAKYIAQTLHQFLPNDYPKAIDILIDSLGEKLTSVDGMGLEVFVYLPHVYYVKLYGLKHFEESMRAQYEITQRFSAEFSIRDFIEKYPELTMERLKLWAKDESFHVRRLVSEGTRPRLPWANQLKGYIKDPSPILPLLEMLKDDEELYVRRSVANNINDITKDNPKIALELCKKWIKDANKNRMWIINHALRTLIKKGDKDALAILGFNDAKGVEIKNINITPHDAYIGKSIKISFELTNTNQNPKNLLIDFSIDYVKSNGSYSNKVFKLKTSTLKPNETQIFSKKVSLKEMTTRKHYSGTHKVYSLINGEKQEIGSFELNK